MQRIYNYFIPKLTKYSLTQNEARVDSQGGNRGVFYIPGKVVPLYIVKVIGL